MNAQIGKYMQKNTLEIKNSVVFIYLKKKKQIGSRRSIIRLFGFFLRTHGGWEWDQPILSISQNVSELETGIVGRHSTQTHAHYHEMQEFQVTSSPLWKSNLSNFLNITYTIQFTISWLNCLHQLWHLDTRK